MSISKEKVLETALVVFTVLAMVAKAAQAAQASGMLPGCTDEDED